MEISIKELRVGNLVETPTNKTHAVKEIFIKGEDCEGAYLIDNWELNAIKPIPLTEEWLIKLGVEEVNMQGYIVSGATYYRVGNIRFYKVDNEYRLAIGEKVQGQGVTTIVFDKVHELQNIYALTGEELTIKQ